MKSIETPQTRCRAGFARIDVTPPIGIYHRMWGAALHDRALSVHRPLTATAFWLQPLDGGSGQLVLGLDHCLLDPEEMERLRGEISRAVPLNSTEVQICLSHTHGLGFLSRERADQPGGEEIGPYLDEVGRRCAQVAAAAAQQARPSTIVYGRGRCSLAANRDYWDADRGAYACGFNPEGAADDTVLVARVTGEDGRSLGTIVNYACHPTTLAWESTAISPDFVGAMREVVEREIQGPCLFLQGASGDLGPREGFVGDARVADRNGRQLGFAALAALEALPQPGTRFVYAGAVLSGTSIATWQHQVLDLPRLERQTVWRSRRWVVPLPFRHDLPSKEETRKQLVNCQAQEVAAAKLGDIDRVRNARARTEQMTRQLGRLESLPAGKTFPYPVTLAQAGEAFWVFVPGELYQVFQTSLRARFPMSAIVVATLCGDWCPGYLPAADCYGAGIYQAEITTLAAGSLEQLIAAVADEIEQLAGRATSFASK